MDKAANNNTGESFPLLSTRTVNSVFVDIDQLEPTGLSNRVLDAVLKNDISTLETLSRKITKDCINVRHQNHENKTIVVIACTEETVKPETLEKLLAVINRNLENFDCIDELWCGWEPIHYVAQVGNPDKLKIVVGFQNVNSLTYFSENPLHILLENNRSTVHGNFNNDLTSIPCSVTNEISENVIKCSEILLEHKIDAFHTNFWGETPAFLALKYEYRDIVENIKEMYPYVDFELADTYEQNQTELPKVENIRAVSLDDQTKTLFDYIKTGRDELFIKFMNGNIREYVNNVDGRDDLNTSGTMLQLCFRKVFLEYRQSDDYHKKLDEDLCDITDSPMLDVFRSSKITRFIEHLLDNGADPKKQTRKFKETLLEAAAVRGFYPLVAILLQHRRSTFSKEEILNVFPKLFESETEHGNQTIYKKFTLNLLLSKLIDLQEGKPFDYAKRKILNEILLKLNLAGNAAKTNDSENIFLLLRLGASLTYARNNDRTVLEQLQYDILKTHFEDCVDNEVLYYDSIVEDTKESYSETKALKLLLTDSKKSNLLTTPVLTVLIHEKWLKIKYLFYANLVFHLFFVVSIYAYIISGFSGNENSWINGLLYVLLFAYTVKEVIQIVLYRVKYLFSPSNYIECTVLVLCFLCIYTSYPQCKTLVILFSTVILFLSLLQVPKFTKFTFILGSLQYFVQYACFYFLPFLSFAIGLYILFPHEDKTKPTSQNSTNIENNATLHDDHIIAELFQHLFETLVLFTGEFNERVLQPKYYPVFGRIFMTVFILCMTIVLNNLLVGLIVSDMDKIEKESRIYKRIKMVNFIIIMNTTKFNRISFMKNLFSKVSLFEKMTVKKIDLTEETKEHFDEVNRKHLEELQKLKWTLYEENSMEKVYEQLHEDGKD